MEIIKAHPPNIEAIKIYLSPTAETIYCYGSKIYNPSGKDLLPDIIKHEETHQKQQEAFTSPEIWWTQYLLDKDFRLSQELEAYREQFKFVKESGVRGKLLDWAKEKMALALSGKEYGSLCSYGQAESWIRHYAKNVIK